MTLSKLHSLGRAIWYFRRQPYYGFIQGHDYLDDKALESIRQLIGETKSEALTEFENLFAGIIGEGKVVSFAAGRMGFYALMKFLGIGEGDEVILQGHTCSVMPNAVWRTGAKPVFADIDPETFGSSAEAVEKVITKRTRMIVAQHSFGIPCEIKAIKELASARGIFLLEDCAITLESRVNGVRVGNFGDAALFSTDHSKPLNTFIGGLIYTRNEELYARLHEIRAESEDLPDERQRSIWSKFLFERSYYNPQNYRKSFLVNIVNKVLRREKDSYLTDDYGKDPSSNYPYPARLPSFLGRLGLYELQRWDEEKRKRQQLLSKYLELSASLGLSKFLPRVYFDGNLEIVPLRFVFTHPDAVSIRKKMAKFIDISWFWFDKPIITCKDPRELGYENGSCSISEGIGKNVINWPCVLDHEYDNNILDIFERVFSE